MAVESVNEVTPRLAVVVAIEQTTVLVGEQG